MCLANGSGIVALCAEAALRALGVEIMQSHENTLLPLKSFFRRLGMTPIAIVHQKDIAR